MTERNEIAKIIDPEAWDRWGKERGGIGFACWPTERQREAAFSKADEIIAPSLAKADAVLARTAVACLG